jgi:hypothetical protein
MCAEWEPSPLFVTNEPRAEHFPFPAPSPQKTLASLGVTSGVRFVMVEDDPGSRRTSILQPHQNPFAMLAGAHGAVCGV